MTANDFLVAVSGALVNIAGRDRAFSNEPLSNKELLAIRERINTLVALNLRQPKEKENVFPVDDQKHS